MVGLDSATEVTTIGRKMVSHAGGWKFADSFHELSKTIVTFNHKVNWTLKKLRRNASDSVGKPVYTSENQFIRRIASDFFFVFFCIFGHVVSIFVFFWFDCWFFVCLFHCFVLCVGVLSILVFIPTNSLVLISCFWFWSCSDEFLVLFLSQAAPVCILYVDLRCPWRMQVPTPPSIFIYMMAIELLVSLLAQLFLEVDFD